eukprot:6184128-Pleurochrysis_carterae.AAC.1
MSCDAAERAGLYVAAGRVARAIYTAREATCRVKEYASLWGLWVSCVSCASSAHLAVAVGGGVLADGGVEALGDDARGAKLRKGLGMGAG